MAKKKNSKNLTSNRRNPNKRTRRKESSNVSKTTIFSGYLATGKKEKPDRRILFSKMM